MDRISWRPRHCLIGGLSALVGWQGSMKPIGRAAPRRSISVPQRGDLGLYLVDLAAQIVRDLLDRHAALVHLEQVRHIHLGPGLAGIDIGAVGWRLLTHTQHEREYRSGLAGIRVLPACRRPSQPCLVTRPKRGLGAGERRRPARGPDTGFMRITGGLIESPEPSFLGQMWVWTGLQCLQCLQAAAPPEGLRSAEGTLRPRAGTVQGTLCRPVYTRLHPPRA